jgi:hypothetical protein
MGQAGSIKNSARRAVTWIRAKTFAVTWNPGRGLGSGKQHNSNNSCVLRNSDALKSGSSRLVFSSELDLVIVLAGRLDYL